MINVCVVDKIECYVYDVVVNGVCVLVGGKCLLEVGEYFYVFIVLVDVNSGMVLCGEEMFGFVVLLFCFVDEVEVV